MGTTLPLFGERKPPPVGRRYWIYWSWLIVLLHDDILVQWCCVRFLGLYLYHGICYADSEKYPVASRSVLKALHRMDEMAGLIYIALQAAWLISVWRLASVVPPVALVVYSSGYDNSSYHVSGCFRNELVCHSVIMWSICIVCCLIAVNVTYEPDS